FNSKDYVPHNRERVFIIGHLRGERTRKVFPLERKNGTTAKNNIKPINNSKKTRELLNFDSTNRFYDVNGISPCLNTMQGGDREPKIAVVGNVIANTLLTGEEKAVVTNNFIIRKLTPRECWRLQGFPDWAFDKAKEVNSDSQLYKQAGNSVTVPVIADIASRLDVNG
ncbi:DNA cytosine methyltransferase, partial [Enterococcus faecalis]